MNDQAIQHPALPAFEFAAHNAEQAGSVKAAEAPAGLEAPERGLGDNLNVTARELLLDETIRERRLHSPDDELRARILLDTPGLIRPIPVLIKGDRFYAVDSSVLIAAARNGDPELRLPVRFVNEQEAWAIRHEHHRPQFQKEPMALARRVLLMTASRLKQNQIANIIGRDESRVAQLLAAARAEVDFADLKAIVIEPERLPSEFWQSLDATVKSLQKLDAARPEDGGRTRLENFKEQVRVIVAEGEMLTAAEIRDRLKLVDLRTSKKVRGRKIGKPVPIPATDQELFVERKRKGGAVLNLPQKLSPDIVDRVIAAVLDMLSRELGQASGSQQN